MHRRGTPDAQEPSAAAPGAAVAPVAPPDAEPGASRRHRRRRWPLAVVVALLAAAGVTAALLPGLRGGGHGRAGSGAHEAAATPPTTTGAVAQAVSAAGGPAGGWVKEENAKPGSAGWRLQNVAEHGEIEGYADHVSVEPGQAVTLFVSTAAPTYRVEAYRMGHYQGLGARLVWQSAGLPGGQQAKPTVTATTNMVEAHWTASLAVSTAGWPPGDYLFKLVADTGKEQYVPLTVRNDASNAAYVLVNAVTTWQAYNTWGGYSLYAGTSGRAMDYAHRSRVVSFDRPYLIGWGSGDFLGNEYPLLSYMESLGLDVTYLTDVDLHERPAGLLAHKAVLSPGHDEYYSARMRQALIDARDAGVNLAFLGANAMFRHIRFEPSPLGDDRHEVCYKSAAEDPLTGKDNADVTVSWRDPPTNLPESTIIGDLYQCNPVHADMVISDAGNWLFEGTGLHDGDHLAGVVGEEYDSYDPAYPHPPDVEILTRSPLTCRSGHDYSNSTYYSAPSGAGVFASGTIAWIAFLSIPCGPQPPCASTAIQGITRNLLLAFGAGPAGSAHPSVPNAGGTSPSTSSGFTSTPTTPAARVSPSPVGYGGRRVTTTTVVYGTRPVATTRPTVPVSR